MLSLAVDVMTAVVVAKLELSGFSVLSFPLIYLIEGQDICFTVSVSENQVLKVISGGSGSYWYLWSLGRRLYRDWCWNAFWYDRGSWKLCPKFILSCDV